MSEDLSRKEIHFTEDMVKPLLDTMIPGIPGSFINAHCRFRKDVWGFLIALQNKKTKRK